MTNDTLTTTLHNYCFHLDTPEGRAGWQALKEKLESQGIHCHESWGGDSHHRPGSFKEASQPVTLETAHLFDDQWNTAPTAEGANGYRVFDWALDAISKFGATSNRNIKRGHYLEQTDAMREVRRNTLKCGYCGHMKAAAQGHTICPDCLGSEYLTQEDLEKGLTRLTPVCEMTPRRDLVPLTDAEKAHFLPLYVAAQTEGAATRAGQRLAKQRDAIHAKFDSATRNARLERDGMLWLMDQGIRIDNCIFYAHTGRFSFGWREAVSPAVADELLQKLETAPINWEIKTTKGDTLTNAATVEA